MAKKRPAHQPTMLADPPQDEIRTLRELTRMPYRAAKLSQEWRGFLGSVPADAQFSILLAGPSGTGKSTLCLQLAREFARLGNVLYVCAEERTKSGTLRLRARLLGISSSRIWMFDTTRYESVVAELSKGNHKFCIIDSIQELDVDDEHIMRIIEQFPNVVFLFVAQVDWTEKYSRGSSKWRHKVDIRLWTDVDEDTQCRWAHNIKNRFAPTVSKRFLFCQADEAKEPASNGRKGADNYNAVTNSRRHRGASVWKRNTSKE